MNQVIPRDVTGQTAVAPTTEAKPVEAPKAVEAKAPEQTPEDDARFAQLARREKQLRSEAKKFQAEKAQWEAERTQSQSKPDNSWQDRLKKDLVGTLAEAGLTYDEVLNTYVNSTPMDQNVRMLKAEIDRVKEELNGTKSTLEKQQADSYQQAVKQIKTEVKQLVKSSPDDFEIINSQGEMAEEAVVKLIERTYKDEGYLMDVEEAVKEVEDYLLEEALKLAKSKKVTAKLTPTQVAAQAEVKQPIVTKTPATLSHNMQAGSKPLSSREKRERAILAFQGKLNQ